MKFIHKAKSVHGEKYDYSQVIYLTNKKPVTIICPVHGAFSQRPDNHLSGKGCKKCGLSNARRSRVLTLGEFLEKAKLKHGETYDYSKVNYINAHSKIVIRCAVHGEFSQEPQHHLAGFGCRGCSKSLPKTNESFKIAAKSVHGEKYDYSKVQYVKAHSKVEIVCPTHGSFLQSPQNHVIGCQGCPKCASFGFNPSEIGFVYVLQAVKFNFFKIGITNHPEQRISRLRKSTPFQFYVEVIAEVEDARGVENLVLSNGKSANLTNFDGATEWLIE